jgi:tellurite methyltransferase
VSGRDIPSKPDSATNTTDADWAAYYAKLAGRPPRPLFSRARSIYLAEGRTRTAVDLGCGDGTETLAMLDDGLSVTAIDQSATSLQLVQERAGTRSGLRTVQARLEAVELPPTDLVYSGLTLPFCQPDHFPALWDRVCGSLGPNGLLAVHLFGDRHGWMHEEMTFLTRDQVEHLVSGLVVLDLREIDEVMPSAAGDKVRMHVFDLVARDPRPPDSAARSARGAWLRGAPG